MKPPVLNPERRSRSFCAISSRATACAPVNSTDVFDRSKRSASFTSANPAGRAVSVLSSMFRFLRIADALRKGPSRPASVSIPADWGGMCSELENVTSARGAGVSRFRGGARRDPHAGAFASDAGGGIELRMTPARSRLPCKRGNFANHVLSTVGFGEEVSMIGNVSLCRPAVPRGDEEEDLWPLFVDLPREVHPVEPSRHLHVGKQHAHIGPGLHRLQSLVSVRGL